jgi:hypothetical protein
VLGLGHTLAQLAEAISGNSDDLEGDELRIDDCVMQFAVDHGERLLRVISVEQREAPVPLNAFAQA